MEFLALFVFGMIVGWWFTSKRVGANAAALVHLQRLWRSNAYSHMQGVLRPREFYDGLEVDFQRMLVSTHGREYLLAVDADQRHWFARLKRVTTDGTTRSATDFVRAAQSGRLEQESLERGEAALADWRNMNEGARDEDWEHWDQLERDREAVSESSESRSRDATKLECAEQDLFAAKHLHWVRLPLADERWIDVAYCHCTALFRETPGLDPRATLEEFLGSAENAIWVPPQHASPTELRESWAKVEGAMWQVRAAKIDDGESPFRGFPEIERFVEPWYQSRK